MTKFTLRILDASNALLGGAVVQGVIRGDGCVWSAGPVTIPITQSGQSESLSCKWEDVNVEVRMPLTERVQAGTALTVYPQAVPLIRVGPMPGPLPPLTVGSVAVAVPVGQLGAGI